MSPFFGVHFRVLAKFVDESITIVLVLCAQGNSAYDEDFCCRVYDCGTIYNKCIMLKKKYYSGISASGCLLHTGQ